MATLEDRLLGEKLHYYCSSSEDEDDTDECKSSIKDQNLHAENPNNINSWEGISTNTGPKGVLKDWQRFKQLETEQRREQEKEKLALAKKLALTCRSALDDEKEKELESNKLEELEKDDPVGNAILQQYILNRMEEMMDNTAKIKVFGTILWLESGDEFLEAVDNEDEKITVIVHLFDQKISACEALNGCLISIAESYHHVKFCCIQASAARLSSNFRCKGLPALLIYKGGQMLANFVRLSDELGEDFYASDVESFLIEHGVLPDKTSVASIIRDGKVAHGSDDDDDSSNN